MDFWSPIQISIKVTLIASMMAFLLAIIAAWWMARVYLVGSRHRRNCGSPSPWYTKR